MKKKLPIEKRKNAKRFGVLEIRENGSVYYEVVKGTAIRSRTPTTPRFFVGFGKVTLAFFFSTTAYIFSDTCVHRFSPLWFIIIGNDFIEWRAIYGRTTKQEYRVL